MSDATDFSLAAIQPEHLAAYLQHRDHKPGKRDPFTLKALRGVSRGGWFMSASRELIQDAGLGEALGFLSNERSTLTRVTGDERVGFAVTGAFRTLQSDEDRRRWDEDQRWGYAWETTLITPEQNAAVAAELDKLWAFCVARIHDHPVLTNLCAHGSPDELLASLRPVENINHATGDDDGNSSDFYLFALHSIRSLLAEAAEQRWTLVHVNDAYVSIVEAPGPR